MKRPTARQVGASAVAVIVAGAVVLMAFSLANSPSEGSDTAAPTTAPSESSGATSAPPEASAPEETDSVPVHDEDWTQPPVPGSLDQETKRFIEAFYLIETTDTPESRRQRVEATGLVSPEAMQMLDFSLSPLDLEYQSYGIVQKAEVDTQTLAATPDESSPAQFQVIVPVTIKWLDESGTVIGEDLPYTISTWRSSGGAWAVIDFSPEVGD